MTLRPTHLVLAVLALLFLAGPLAQAQAGGEDRPILTVGDTWTWEREVLTEGNERDEVRNVTVVARETINAAGMDGLEVYRIEDRSTFTEGWDLRTAWVRIDDHAVVQERHEFDWAPNEDVEHRYSAPCLELTFPLSGDTTITPEVCRGHTVPIGRAGEDPEPFSWSGLLPRWAPHGEWSVSGPTSVEVPAGRFSAHLLTRTWTSDGEDHRVRAWWSDAACGFVQIDLATGQGGSWTIQERKRLLTVHCLDPEPPEPEPEPEPRPDEGAANGTADVEPEGQAGQANGTNGTGGDLDDVYDELVDARDNRTPVPLGWVLSALVGGALLARSRGRRG